MPLETFVGPEIAPLLSSVNERFGDDARVVHTRAVSQWDDSPMFEILAGDAEGASAWRPGYCTRGTAPELTCVAPLEVPNVKRNPRSHHPLKIALVGPTGAGKTTTIAKLIGHPRIFGTKAVGLLSLDTYRIGAVEQLRIYADIAHVPLEVVYETADVQRCFRRLADLDVVLIDTPGRGPRSRRDRDVVDRWFRLIAPDEVHLTLPAGLQRQLVTATVKQYLCGNSVTHLLATKLDEMWSDWTVFELAAKLHLPMRWVTDGQEVPADIRGASPRLLAALASSHSRAEATVEGAA